MVDRRKQSNRCNDRLGIWHDNFPINREFRCAIQPGTLYQRFRNRTEEAHENDHVVEGKHSGEDIHPESVVQLELDHQNKVGDQPAVKKHGDHCNLQVELFPDHIFLMTAFISTAYSFWYFPDESLKTVNTDMKVDDIEENFKEKDTYGSYLKIIDCRDGVIPKDTDFAIQSESGFLDNSENFTDNGNIFRGKKGEDNKYQYSKKVFGVSSSKVNALYKYPFKGEYALKSFVSSVFYGSDTSMTEIYLYDLLNSQYKLVDHLTYESIELIRNGTSSDESYFSTKFEDYREKIGYSFSKSRILFLVPRDTELIKNKQSETPKVVSDYNIYFHNEATGGDYDYSKLDYVWLWNDRTDFGVSLPLNCSETIDGTSYKALHIDYKTLYKACNDFNDTNEAGFIMMSQTAPTDIIFKTKD